jgi:hypothetical protein
MQRKRRWALALLITMGLSLAACAKTSHTEEAIVEPAKVEKISGTDLNKLTLEKQAVDRLGITTATVDNLAPPVAGQSVVPYSALIYDANGQASVYTNPAPLEYVRAPVNVVIVIGNNAVLSQGPSLGTPVVTVGAAELFGIDSGIGGNE